MFLKFPEKLDYLFSHVFIFGNMFSESHGLVTMSVQAISKIHVQIYISLIGEGRRNCSTL